MREEKTYLEDILESINRIERYIENLRPINFLESEVIQDGVMKRIEIIGEAVKHLSNEMKDKHPEIPWKNIAGMRDILIHEYAGVQVERVWQTAKNDLPPLKKVIIKIIKQTN